MLISVFAKHKSMEAAEFLCESPVAQRAVIFSLHESNTKVRPGMLEDCGGLLEVYTGENIAHPAGHIQDILESDIMAISAPLLSPNSEYDCSNAKHRHSALVCKGKDMGFVSGIGFEARETCGEMYVRD
jgi:hypothetical protein